MVQDGGIGQPPPPAEFDKLDVLIQLQRDTIAQLKKAMIIIPPDPEMLAMAGQLRAEAGRMFIPTWRVALACLAGVTTVLPFLVPPGWVTYRRKPLEISSDLYDPLLGLNVYSDAILINPVAPMPITGAFTVDMGEYVTQWTQLVVEVINGTANDAVVSFQVCTYLFDASYWDEFITPMIDKVAAKVEEIIK
ncbi:unnamed protein product [marine sediment metagenome]|uniref:Uncharacterized protein n=1 Tax=marine sediment metagenome TaxID=412755 RepID=X1T636_9ZZZZ